MCKIIKDSIKDNLLIKEKIAFQEGFPVRILQFGEGNFLRAFVDWMIDILNEKTDFSGRIRIIQPLARGMVSKLNDQSGAYTVISRGIKEGKLVQKERVITSVESGVNPYKNPEAFFDSACLEDLRFVFSNTTEAGIAYCSGESINDRPPVSFPGKVVQLLYNRYNFFKADPSKGLIFIPCELIDNNGTNLKQIVFRLIEEWQLGDSFKLWVKEHNFFMNSLVDRIVPGYPRNEAPELNERWGYQDNLCVACEDFHLWVIEGDSRVKRELPFCDAGLNVVWTQDMSFYRTRKVRVLNGVHTMISLLAFLCGLDTVKDCLEDNLMNEFIHKGLFNEILPSFSFSSEDIRAYAESVLERFSNPFIIHNLLSISLNSISKFKTRVLPSILEYSRREQSVPPFLVFSLAALILFFRTKEINEGKFYGKREEELYPLYEDSENLKVLNTMWKDYSDSLADALTLSRKVLSYTNFWGMNLTAQAGLEEQLGLALFSLTEIGVKASLLELIKKERL